MTLQETVESQELAALDYSKVAALQQKRTLAFVNHFVTSTAQFLNNFMMKCEHKLMQFERKLEKVEASMVLLEARLSSIPEINSEPEKKPELAADTTDTSATSAPTDQNDTGQPANASSHNPPEPTEPSNPEYDRFIKMVQVGVPLEAVKLKVSIEGLNPDIFVKLIGK